jgi:hypothetical protein
VVQQPQLHGLGLGPVGRGRLEQQLILMGLRYVGSVGRLRLHEHGKPMGRG